jgi:hypothetical protein
MLLPSIHSESPALKPAFRRSVTFVAGFAIAIGAMWLLAWAIGIPQRLVNTSIITMKTNMALSLVLTIALSLLALAAPALAQDSRNVTLLSTMNLYPDPTQEWSYSTVWSYVHSDGREYAILAALYRAERFVWVGSEASLRSTFCAFEIGWARSRGIPARAVSLDGSLPPPFFADVQAVDLPRRRAARPWLSDDEALVEALLDALA